MSKTKPTENYYMTPVEAAEYLNMGVATLEKWRSLGKGPPYFVFSARAVRYNRQELLDWVDSKRSPGST